MPSIADLIINVRANIGQATAAISDLDKKLKTSADAAAKGPGSGIQSVATRVASATGPLGRDFSVGLTAPIAAAGTFIYRHFTSWEDALAELRRTTGLADDEFQSLSKTIRGMSLEQGMPSAPELAGIASVLAQQGVPGADLPAVLRVQAMVGKVSNFGGEEGAETLAKFLIGSGANRADIEKIGSSLLASGVFGASNERDMMNVATRMASAGKRMGLTPAQIIGIANAASSASGGLGPEATGTSMQRLLNDMVEAAAGGGGGKPKDNTKSIRETGERLDDLQKQLAREQQTRFSGSTDPKQYQAHLDTLARLRREIGDTEADLGKLRDENGKPTKGKSADFFARAMGMSSSDFMQLTKSDPAAALTRFFQGFGKLSSDEQLAFFDDLGTDAQRFVNTISALGSQVATKNGGFGTLDEYVARATDAFAAGTELSRQFNTKVDTLSNSVDRLGHQMEAAAGILGEKFGPRLKAFLDTHGTKFLDWIDGLATKFTTLDPSTQNTILLFVGLAAAIGPVLLIVSQLLTGLAAFVTLLQVARPLLAVVAGAIGLPGLAIVGLIAGLALLVVAWNRDWGGIQEKAAGVATFLTDKFEAVKKKMGEIGAALKTDVLTVLANLFETLAKVPGVGKIFEPAAQWFRGQVPKEGWTAHDAAEPVPAGAPAGGGVVIQGPLIQADTVQMTGEDGQPTPEFLDAVNKALVDAATTAYQQGSGPRKAARGW